MNAAKGPPKKPAIYQFVLSSDGFRFLQIRIQNDGEYDKINDNY